MDDAIYDDGTITVTATEIRGRGFVLNTDKVSSISVKTVRPGNWFALFAAVAVLLIIAIIWCTNQVSGSLLAGQSSVIAPVSLVAIAALCVMGVGAFLVRISRLFLQTSSGPVMLASQICLSDAYDTEMKYREIKRAIEKAISLRRRITPKAA